jgi:hypothetical protein
VDACFVINKNTILVGAAPDKATRYQYTVTLCLWR